MFFSFFVCFGISKNIMKIYSEFYMHDYISIERKSSAELREKGGKKCFRKHQNSNRVVVVVIVSVNLREL